MFDIIEVSKDNAELASLVNELDGFQNALYPPQSNHCLDLATVDDERLRCFVIYDAHHSAVGSGAILLSQDNTAEIKRVFIRPACRGHKLGERLIAHLEQAAVACGCVRLQLESGIYQQPALRMYQNCGYKPCDTFAPYEPDPLSVFMFKYLK